VHHGPVTRAPYIHALGLRRLNRLYDPLFRLTMPEDAFRSRVLEQARLAPGMRILDMGCGTGTLLIDAFRVQSDITAVGVDGDPSIVELASSKAVRAGAAVRFVAGLANRVPFRSGVFDRVFSTLMLHHLTHAEKTDALSESNRVLRSGGELHIADWGPPHTKAMHVASMLLRSFERPDRVDENLAGQLPELCRQAGFRAVRSTHRFRTVFGTLELIAAMKAPRHRREIVVADTLFSRR
jgi:ubiquinone/menaquinone biosynthesis C-methylase UbiE